MTHASLPAVPRSTGTRWLGLDIGGANLKASDGALSLSEPFALWREPGRLTPAVTDLLARFDRYAAAGAAGAADALAVTMTGELADCFATKAEGVRHIVAATLAAAGPRSVRFATNDDTWIEAADAAADPARVAAANWRLFARWATRATGHASATVIDVGSTTIDITPVSDGRIGAQGLDDPSRLIAEELLYMGVRRTPVCALVDRLPYQGRECPVAAELFATAADAWLLVGELSESSRTDTADGKPFRRRDAMRRLARCVGADTDACSSADCEAMAAAIVTEQTRRLAQAIDRQTTTACTLIAGGEGEFLVRRAACRLGWTDRVVSVADRLGREASAAGPALAAARLAAAEMNLRAVMTDG